MEFQLDCKREYFEELLYKLGKEWYDKSKTEFNQTLKEIPLLGFVLLFLLLIFKLHKILCFIYILIAIFILIGIIKNLLKHRKLGRSFKEFSWNYSEAYYKELLSYKSVVLSTIGEHNLELNIDNEITMYDLHDISAYRIEDEFVYFLFNKDGSLIVPSKAVKSNNFNDLKLFCSQAISEKY
ncbi:MAG: hypothetical protein U0U67_03825 [Chitinophagales bacterium]